MNSITFRIAKRYYLKRGFNPLKQISHSTFNASFSYFLILIHGVRFSVSEILSSNFVFRTAFSLLPFSLRFSCSFGSLWIPHSWNELLRFLFRLASPRSFLPMNSFGFRETARKRNG
ncbi:hypothetical protein VNO78_31133 [Psophocarpus tetragonolobus]|uniref:Uncharacterized protein n=1 Tax=Psophocarpus tetragonolobus TaxID=3891 RepID=A0AAN9RYH4_PSOTE